MKSTELTNEITPFIISLEPDQVRFGDRKIAAWSGPRRVFFQNNYIIFFFSIFAREAGSRRE